MSTLTALLASGAGLMAAALLIEALIGYPKQLYAHVRHPVVWIGAGIDALDRALNKPHYPPLARRFAGCFTALLIIGLAAGAGHAIALLLPNTLTGRLAEAAIASTLLAQRSLYEHVNAIATPLAAQDLEAARGALSQIVGRDVEALDLAGIARASIESLAENFSDGIVAPVFWGVLLGLPGIAAYKAFNTLDSMIGHRTPRHEAFGWASARLDDIANLIPARLAALLIAIAALSRAPAAMASTLRDAHHHRSPNAGWPEAAMAGALGIRLSGPRLYAGHVAQEPWVNARGRDPDAGDVRRSLGLYVKALVLLLALVAATAWVLA